MKTMMRSMLLTAMLGGQAGALTVTPPSLPPGGEGLKGRVMRALEADPRQAGGDDADALYKKAAEIADKTMPSVVEFKGFDEKSSRSGLGSGFFVDARGYLITNNHVAELAFKLPEGAGGQPPVEVLQVKHYKAPGGKVVDGVLWAVVVAKEPKKDLALLRVIEKGPSWPALALAEDSAIQRARFVMAFGSPFGHTESVTFGRVSAGLDVARRRFLERFKGMSTDVKVLQVDAALNPGNSGGPVVDLDGKALGVTFAGSLPWSTGASFCVAASEAQKLVQDSASEMEETEGALDAARIASIKDRAAAALIGAHLDGRREQEYQDERRRRGDDRH